MKKIAWQREVLRLSLIIFLATAAGNSFDKPLWGFIIGLVFSQALLLRNLHALFLWSNNKGPVPQDSGLIGHSVDLLVKRERILNKKIKKQKNQLERIFSGMESLQDGVLIVDKDGCMVAFNTAACRLLGLRKETDLGQHITNLIRAPHFIKYFEHGKFSKAVQIENPQRVNSTVQIQVVKFGRNQQLLMIRDVTERQRVESMRQNFLADVSHELRTPLTVIHGYLEMLSDVDVNPGVNRAIHQMNEQTERMKILVNDLLHLSKLESNNSDSDQDWFDLNSLGEMCVDQLQNYTPVFLTDLDTPKTEIQYECSVKIEAYGCVEEVNSILTNLITNAIKYGRKEGKAAQVKVSIHPVKNTVSGVELVDDVNTGLEGGVEVAIEDQGDGIAENHLAHLTERFYRVDESRESTVGGSGLGLSIVRHALENHGALLKITSELGKGSRFSFVIPDDRIRLIQPNDYESKSRS